MCLIFIGKFVLQAVPTLNGARIIIIYMNTNYILHARLFYLHKSILLFDGQVISANS